MEEVLRDAADKALRDFAYQVKQLTMDPVTAPQKPEEAVVVDVPWQGRSGRTVSFHIETRLKLSSTGAGTYHARGLPDREEWLEDEVGRALKASMHSLDVLDLIPENEKSIRDELHHRLNEQATTIGHAIETFLAEPSLPEKTWT